jgi:hypothetical protein
MSLKSYVTFHVLELEDIADTEDMIVKFSDVLQVCKTGIM